MRLLQARHYDQLRQLELLIDPTKSRRRRQLTGTLLLLIGAACLGVVAALVVTVATPIYPISLGGTAGALLAAGTIMLIDDPDGTNSSGQDRYA